MRPIAMINQKGGVGKTTTAVNIAAALAGAGQRVLLIDLDPQTHATMHLGIESAPGEPSVYEVLVNGVSVDAALREAAENLAVIPAHLDLVGVELELARRPERELILRDALRPLCDRFDTMIIDCPPSLGTLTINALAAVDEVIIPLQPHFLALQGLGRLLETVSLVRDVLSPTLRISGIVLCMYEKGTRLAQEVESDVRRFVADALPEDAWHGARVFDATIRRNVKLAECPSFGQTIFQYAPSSHGAKDYAALARELRQMTAPAAGEVAETLVVKQAAVDANAVVPPGSRVEAAAGTPAIPDAATP